MVTLTERQNEIIKLLNQYHILSADKIAKMLNVSTKTIRNEIHKINSSLNLNYIISQKGTGYLINEQIQLEKEYASEQNIQHLILKKILNHDFYNFYELADELFISESNLQRHIKRVNEIIQKRNSSIKICRQQNQLYLNGTETEKRQITTYFLMNELNQYNFNLSMYQSLFLRIDILELQKIITEFNNAHHLNLRDVEIISLVIHVALMLERVIRGNEIINEVDFVNDEYNHLSIQFANILQIRYEIKLNKSEIKYLSLLLAGKVPSIEENDINEVKQFIQQLIIEINESFDVDLQQDSKFADSFLIHLIGLKRRITNHTFLNNPLIKELQKNFPVIYDMSVFIALKIQEFFSTQLYEDEIGYITLHLMGAIERLHTSLHKKIVLIYPFGQAGYDYIVKKINHIHDLEIEICCQLSMFDAFQIKEYQPDLVISFVHIEEKVGYPIYVCHNLLLEEDIENIYNILKGNHTFKKNVFFEKELFHIYNDIENKEDVIHRLCESLYYKGYVDQQYEGLVLAREQIAPTAYGSMFAIPHAVKKAGFATRIAVALLDKPIDWNQQKVRLVFLFCLTKERNEEFDLLFEKLVGLLDESKKVKELLKCKDYEEFLELFLSE
ncbi:BglG family transcription antiterminator [Faecalibacillus intestinalis]|uniref:BglG family transcription antiterminator n=1 Tax=Faecalibacillus intestinalis TaxID=1982626 RepID=UPI002E763ABF|nr:PTS sugar transporter subunit IIA [Faecalibacillus intestinalis]MED9808980.1 PTS sugar transporter subunit IIA [Faecalibacillus intestinalis]